MRLKSLKSLCLALGLLAAFSGAAKASTIDYLFVGEGTGTLGGTPFSNFFSILAVGDTSAATLGGPGISTNITPVGIFITPALNATFNSGAYVELNTNNPTHIDFSQTTAPGGDHGGIGVFIPALSSFTLASLNNFPLTSGSVFTGAPDETFGTNNGNLVFNSISSLAFEAIEPSPAPLPATLPMFLAGLAGLAAFGYYRRRAVQAK